MPVPTLDAFVMMRATRQKADTYKRVAEAEGLRVSAWLRQLADRRVAEHFEQEKADEAA